MTIAIILIAVIVVAIVGYLVTRSGKSGEELGEGDKPTKPLPKPEEPTKRPDAVGVKPPTKEPVREVPPAKEPATAGTAVKGPEPKSATSSTATTPDASAATPATPAGSQPATTASAEVKPATAETPAAAGGTPATDAATAKPESVRPPAQPATEVVKPPNEPRRGAREPSSSPKRDITALRKGLEQTRGGWVQRLVGIFGGGKKELSPELLEQIQETLLTGDVGPKTTERLTEALKTRLGGKDAGNEEAVWSTLRSVALDVIDVPSPAFGAKAGGKTPMVILVVGVNGVGKTTTIGKLASRYKEQGKKVYLAAADTFRAAAVAQLELWGKRVGVPVVKGKDLSKPSAVVFDAVQAGIKEGADIIIADTAGRLHTKTPLMDELRKLRDAAGKALPGAPHEILLVLDATTGQNGLIQVKEFRDALDVSGIVLTKLDGTAKGGVILAICDEFKLPVRFVGVGEKVDDLREFDPDDFTHALFSSSDEAAA